jgi:hypothetical protein
MRRFNYPKIIKYCLIPIVKSMGIFIEPKQTENEKNNTGEYDPTVQSGMSLDAPVPCKKMKDHCWGHDDNKYDQEIARAHKNDREGQ